MPSYSFNSKLYLYFSTSTQSCEVTLSKALKVLDQKYLKTDEVTFESALRPISGDDLPIVGKCKFWLFDIK